MKILRAFCAYMEGVADGVRIWFDFVAAALFVLWLLSTIFIKDASVEQLARILDACIAFGFVGLLTPKSDTWRTWYYMLKEKR